MNWKRKTPTNSATTHDTGILPARHAGVSIDCEETQSLNGGQRAALAEPCSRSLFFVSFNDHQREGETGNARVAEERKDIDSTWRSQ
eukprot:749481-Hanusia_phi.AAC.1